MVVRREAHTVPPHRLEDIRMADDDEPMARPDGHRYDAPESDDDRRSKSWDYAILGILVVVILLLIATGKVPIFNF
jgi:hypothetical protein